MSSSQLGVKPHGFCKFAINEEEKQKYLLKKLLRLNRDRNTHHQNQMLQFRGQKKCVEKKKKPLS